MKRTLRIGSLLLALITVLSCLLTGCGETEKPEDSSSVTTPSVGPDNSDPVETDYDPLAHVNIKKLGGETYLLLTPSHDWAVTNLTSDEISGDVIQDTIYSRQMKAEELLECKFEETVGTAVSVLKTASAGAVEDAYCLALAPAYDALALYKDGYIVDQAKLSSINFDNPWWEESFNSDVNIGNGRYVTFSQASLIYYSSFYIFCFNKEMVENNRLDSPYDLVKSGDWTWDKAYEMMQTAAIDEGADGVFTAGVDTFGLTGHIHHSRNIRFSCGYTICEDTENGSLNYNGLSTAYVEAFEKFTNNFIMSPYVAISGASGSKYTGYTGEAGVKNYISVFKEGKSLFLTTGTNEVMQIRDAAIEYGVVCVPKYSKDQENYITPVYSATAGFVIPKIGTTENQETAAMILEVLGALSYGDLVDKHIGLVLHSRVAQDPTAIEMINIAYSSGAVDKAMANNFGTCTSLINNLDTAGMTTVSSIFKAAETKIKKDIQAAEAAVGIN